MKRSNAFGAELENQELEFPDWGGMEDSSRGVSTETAFQLCEQYLTWFPEASRRRHAQARDKCLVEFKL
jgi:hypothetical protein